MVPVAQGVAGLRGRGGLQHCRPTAPLNRDLTAQVMGTSTCWPGHSAARGTRQRRRECRGGHVAQNHQDCPVLQPWVSASKQRSATLWHPHPKTLSESFTSALPKALQAPQAWFTKGPRSPWPQSSGLSCRASPGAADPRRVQEMGGRNKSYLYPESPWAAASLPNPLPHHRPCTVLPSLLTGPR